MTLPPVYAIVDQETARRHGWEVPALARAYLEGGARLLQVRAPTATGAELLRWCEEIVADAHACQAQVIVNNRVDIAILAGADGVHVGQTDLDLSRVRRMLSVPAVVGLSTHTCDQVDGIAPDTATYAAVGPIYETRTKATGYDAVGGALVRYAARRLSCPLVAIGGITLERAPAVIDEGASAVAVISDLLVGNDPVRRVRDYVEALGSRPK